MTNLFFGNFKPAYTLGLVILLSASCVTPYDINSTQFQDAIVVEGMITDQPGPYLVQISKPLPVSQQGDFEAPVSNASVTIKDDQGNAELLVEKSSGNYYTNTFQGVVGRSYSISITTNEGSTYQSASEKLLPVGNFANLRYEFVQNEPGVTDRQITSKNGFNIFLDSDVLPEQEGRVWWRWTGTFEIFTYPQLEVVPGNTKAASWVPAPPQCSGYYVFRGTLMGPRFTCQCCTCWISQYNHSPLISNVAFVNNNEIKNQFIGFVEANVRTMYNKYYFEVEQLSVSQTVYDFWKEVKAQKQNSSNLFQTPPARTSGNITATSKNAIPAIGYFAASSVIKHSISLDKTLVPYPIQAIDTVAESCLSVYKNSTTTKPIFW